MPSLSPSEPIAEAVPHASSEESAYKVKGESPSLRLEDWLIVLVMTALALITFANVLVRYFTSASFAWTEEISVFLMIVLALVGGSAAVVRNQHIRIEYFAEGGSAARSRRMALLGAAAVALLFGLIAILSVRVVWDDYRFDETSPGIGVPQWWYSVCLPVFSTLITVRAVGQFIRGKKRRLDQDVFNKSSVEQERNA